MIDEFGPCERLLVVAPHPDDAEVGCAGTVARLTQEGVEVYYLIATNGDKGTEDTSLTRWELARIRAEEQRAAAAILGVKEVTILDHGDGELEDDRAFRGEVVYHIRRIKPDVVLTTDPFRVNFYIHRDHRITGLVTMDAVFPFARDVLHFPEHLEQGLTTHKTAEIYFWQAEEHDTFVDITDTIDVKIAALAAHKSQFSQFQEDSEGSWVRRWAARQAEGRGMEYAEAFRAYGIRRIYQEIAEENR